MKYSLVFGIFLLLFAAPFALADSGSISVCKGENAVFEFELYNQADPLTYTISPSGITGTLSTTAISLGAGEKATFTFTVPTQNRAEGNYPFTIIADGGVSVSRASGLLTVSDCYSSALSLNTTTATVQRCGSVPITATLQNTGSKQDSFALSSSGALSVAFSPGALTIGSSGSSSSTAVVSVPCSTAAGAYLLFVNSSGHSKQSIAFTVYVTAPTPTPTPAGCAYSNPACVSPKVCQNNACVMPSGCKYSNPSCGAGFYCNNASNTCVENPVAAPVMNLAAIRACKGEVARFKFSVNNPGDSPASFNVTSKGNLSGRLSASSITVPAASAVDVYYTINTTGMAVGSYPFSITASNSRTSGTVASKLQVDDCFASNLTLVSAASTSQPAVSVTPSPSPSATIVASATPSPAANASATPAPAANASNATKTPNVLWAIAPQGLVLEAGVQKTITIGVRNSADYDVGSVVVSISNMTLSVAKVASIPAGKSVNVDLVVSTSLSKPFNATVKLAGDKGSGATVFFVNATEGRVAAKTVKSSASVVNGTNGTVELVNATVRLYNYANASVNATVSAQGSAVNVTPSNVTIPAKSYAEITLLAQVPKGEDRNATLSVSASGSTYALPVSIRMASPSASTGMFSGNLVSMFSLAVVAIGVILVLFYFARRQPGDDEDAEETDSDDSDEAQPKEEKKPASKKKR